MEYCPSLTGCVRRGPQGEAHPQKGAKGTEHRVHLAEFTKERLEFSDGAEALFMCSFLEKWKQQINPCFFPNCV